MCCKPAELICEYFQCLSGEVLTWGANDLGQLGDVRISDDSCCWLCAPGCLKFVLTELWRPAPKTAGFLSESSSRPGPQSFFRTAFLPPFRMAERLRGHRGGLVPQRLLGLRARPGGKRLQRKAILSARSVASSTHIQVRSGFGAATSRDRWVMAPRTAIGTHVGEVDRRSAGLNVVKGLPMSRSARWPHSACFANTRSCCIRLAWQLGNFENEDLVGEPQQLG